MPTIFDFNFSKKVLTIRENLQKKDSVDDENQFFQKIGFNLEEFIAHNNNTSSSVGSDQEILVKKIKVLLQYLKDQKFSPDNIVNLETKLKGDKTQNFLFSFYIDLKSVVEIYMNLKQESSKNDFKVMFTSLDLNQCSEGAVENLGRLSQLGEGFAPLLSRHKYMFFEKLANIFYEQHPHLKRNEEHYQIHDITSLLLVVSDTYKLQIHTSVDQTYIKFQDTTKNKKKRELIKNFFKEQLTKPNLISEFIEGFFQECSDIVLMPNNSGYIPFTSHLVLGSPEVTDCLPINTYNKVIKIPVTSKLNPLNLDFSTLKGPKDLERLLDSQIFRLLCYNYCESESLENEIFLDYLSSLPSSEILFDKFEEKFPLIPKYFPNFIETLTEQPSENSNTDDDQKALDARNLAHFLNNLTRESQDVSSVIAPCRNNHLSHSSLSKSLDFLIEYRLYRLGFLTPNGEQKPIISDWEFFNNLSIKIKNQSSFLENDNDFITLFDICERRDLFEALTHVLLQKALISHEKRQKNKHDHTLPADLLIELIDALFKVDPKNYPNVFAHLCKTIQQEIPLIGLYYDEKTRRLLEKALSLKGQEKNTIFTDQNSSLIDFKYQEIAEHKKSIFLNAIANSDQVQFFFLLLLEAFFEENVKEQDLVIYTHDDNSQNALFQVFGRYEQSEDAKKIFEFLCEFRSGVLLTEANRIGQPILHHIINMNNTTYDNLITQILSNENIDFKYLNSYNIETNTILHSLIAEQMGTQVEILLQRSPNTQLLFNTNCFNETPLHLAFKVGNLEIVSSILSKIDNINDKNEKIQALHNFLKIKDDSGSTPLHIALQQIKSRHSYIKDNLNYLTKNELERRYLELTSFLQKIDDIFIRDFEINENSINFNTFFEIQNNSGETFLHLIFKLLFNSFPQRISDLDDIHFELLESYQDTIINIIQKILKRNLSVYQLNIRDISKSKNTALSLLIDCHAAITLDNKTTKSLYTEDSFIYEGDFEREKYLKNIMLNFLHQLLKLGAEPCKIYPLKNYTFFLGKTNKEYFEELDELQRYKKAYAKIASQNPRMNFEEIREIFMNQVNNYRGENIDDPDITIFEMIPPKKLCAPSSIQKNSKFW